MKNVKSLYIHIPFCFSKCKYCDFFSVVKDQNYFNEYINALCHELEYRLSKNNLENYGTIYIGGGTPSLLSGFQLSKIMDTVNKFVHLNNLSEITIEANPDDITKEFLFSIADLGFTRISVGLQSMNEDVLKFAGRRADKKTNLEALHLIKKYWKGSLSVDLISGLPHENVESFTQGIETVIKYNPDHVSLYSLTIEDETPFGQMYNSNKLKYDWDFADSMWLCGRDLLVKNGYEQYEVSNFSMPGKNCIHNLTYWNHENYIGAGSGGTGTVYPKRWTNTKNISEYIKFWSKAEVECELPQSTEQIDFETEKIEFFMMGLRKLCGIKNSEYKKYFSENIPEKVQNKLQEWNCKKLILIEQTGADKIYRMTSEGILFLNKLLEEIFICLE